MISCFPWFFECLRVKGLRLEFFGVLGVLGVLRVFRVLGVLRILGVLRVLGVFRVLGALRVLGVFGSLETGGGRLSVRFQVQRYVVTLTAVHLLSFSCSDKIKQNLHFIIDSQHLALFKNSARQLFSVLYQ